MVDDNVLGGGLASWGASEELICLLMEFRCPWGVRHLPEAAFDDGSVEGVRGGDVWGVAGGGGPGLGLDQRVGDVDGGLVDDYAAILLTVVLGGWGRGQADHVVVLVVVVPLLLDLDLTVLEVAVADVFVVISLLLLVFLLTALIWGEARAGLRLASPDSSPLLVLPGVKSWHISGLLSHDGFARRSSHFPLLLLLLLAR